MAHFNVPNERSACRDVSRAASRWCRSVGTAGTLLRPAVSLYDMEGADLFFAVVVGFIFLLILIGVVISLV
jgi:hypothetical protein